MHYETMSKPSRIIKRRKKVYRYKNSIEGEKSGINFKRANPAFTSFSLRMGYPDHVEGLIERG